MKLIHLVSEVQELYRKRSPWEIRKWNNRRNKGREIARICGIGSDYHLASRADRRAYDSIASSVMKIQRLETDILRITGIMEMLSLSGIARNQTIFWLDGVRVKVNVQETNPWNLDKPSRPYAEAYLEVEYEMPNPKRHLRIDRVGKVYLPEEVEAGVEPRKIAYALTHILDVFPVFKDDFIKTVTEKINKEK